MKLTCVTLLLLELGAFIGLCYSGETRVTLAGLLMNRRNKKDRISRKTIELLKVENPLRSQPDLSTKQRHGRKRHRKGGGKSSIKGIESALVYIKAEYLKQDWCKTRRLTQVIREEGCRKRTIMNRFCYGQCNSFYIPKGNRDTVETTAFKSCAFCKPKEYDWITVTLKCYHSARKGFRNRKKQILRIKKCKCMAQPV